jgi:hypothetical protein
MSSPIELSMPPVFNEVEVRPLTGAGRNTPPNLVNLFELQTLAPIESATYR